MRLHHHYGPEARYAVEREARLPTAGFEREVARGLELGLAGADSIADRRIPTFARGELPHFAGIDTFLKAPYVEDVRGWGDYDVVVLGAPFDGGTTYRPGTRFGPQGIRQIMTVTDCVEMGIDAATDQALEVAWDGAVECLPPYDNADITALIATRVIRDTLGCLVRAGHLPERSTLPQEVS